MNCLRWIIQSLCIFGFGVVVTIGNRAGAAIFTLDPASPSLAGIPATAADILVDVPGVGGVPGVYPPPSVALPFGLLGLQPGDVVDAISDGLDAVQDPLHLHYFSVTRGSSGVPGSGVFRESTIADSFPGFLPGQAGDIFLAGNGVPANTNILAPAGFGWSLGTGTGDEANVNLITPTISLPLSGDELNSLDMGAVSPAAPLFFSLAPGSPTLVALGATPADILVGGAGGPPAIFAPAAALGLPPGTDIDALAMLAGIPIGPGMIEFSLTNATAGLLGVTGGDILTAGGLVVHGFASLGLTPNDDLDALDVGAQAVPEPSSALLAAFGSLGLLARRRRDRKYLVANGHPQAA
jgi:hypothetical protein